MVTDEEREIVLARLDNMPPHMKLSIGGGESISKDKLIEHVRKGDPIGNKFVQIQLNYIRTVAKEYV